MPPLRTIVVIGTVVAVIVGLALAGVSVIFDTSLGLGGASHETKVATVASLLSFVLVSLTVLVALITYLATTGQPNLEPVIQFRFSDPNRPVFQAEIEQLPGLTSWKVKNYRQVEGRVTLKNTSKYSARNPGLRIDFHGMHKHLGELATPGWTSVARANQVGTLAVQWDGGADFPIHGQWSRELPFLDFTDVVTTSTEPVATLVVTVVADGLRPKVLEIPVEFLDETHYTEYSARRHADFMASLE